MTAEEVISQLCGDVCQTDIPVNRVLLSRALYLACMDHLHRCDVVMNKSHSSTGGDVPPLTHTGLLFVKGVRAYRSDELSGMEYALVPKGDCDE